MFKKTKMNHWGSAERGAEKEEERTDTARGKFYGRSSPSLFVFPLVSNYDEIATPASCAGWLAWHGSKQARGAVAAAAEGGSVEGVKGIRMRRNGKKSRKGIHLSPSAHKGGWMRWYGYIKNR